jgi:hypothetical protein
LLSFISGISVTNLSFLIFFFVVITSLGSFGAFFSVISFFGSSFFSKGFIVCISPLSFNLFKMKALSNLALSRLSTTFVFN